MLHLPAFPNKKFYVSQKFALSSLIYITHVDFICTFIFVLEKKVSVSLEELIPGPKLRAELDLYSKTICKTLWKELIPDAMAICHFMC